MPTKRSAYARQARQKSVELQERRIGIRCCAKNAEQLGHELGQDLARPLAACRAEPSVMPPAHQCGDGSRLDKAEPGNGVQGFRIILDAGKNETAALRRGQFRLAFEQAGVMRLHRLQGLGQGGGERSGRGQR